MTTMTNDAFFSPAPAAGPLGGAQHEVLFSVMKVIHRQPTPVPPATALPAADKVARLSCCCRLSELLPLVRQLHVEARARHQAALAGEQRQQAA